MTNEWREGYLIISEVNFSPSAVRFVTSAKALGSTCELASRGGCGIKGSAEDRDQETKDREAGARRKIE